MAKKKTESEGTELSTRDLIKKTYGDIISSGRDLINKPVEILHVSPRLDGIMGGGIPDGHAVFISGQPKTGKTSVILRMCKQAQEQNREVWYFDVEHRLKKMNLEGCHGLNLDQFNHIHSAPGNILSAEKILNLVKRLATDIPRSFIVIDSFGALVTEGQLIEELKGAGRTDLHKLLSNFHTQLAPIISINNNIVVGVNHIHADVGYGPQQWAEGGSSKGRYMADIKLKVIKAEPWLAGDQRIGQKMTWVCDFGGLGAIPGSKCESYLKYGYGVDVLNEKIMDAIDLGIIEKKAAWFACDFITKRTGEEKPPQFNGEARLYTAISENTEWQTWLDEDLKELGAI